MTARSLVVVIVTALTVMSGSAFGDAAAQKTVEALNVEKTQLKGKQVSFKGKVVKVNNGIMKKNFLHIQDGTGKEGTNDVTITSDQTAQVGDQVAIVGKVAINRDFGAGYVYPLIIEESKISPAK